MIEKQEIKTYKRKKKGGSRKCVVVKGYTRTKPLQSTNKTGEKDD